MMLERFDKSAMMSLIDDLNQAMTTVADTQREIIEVTGTAWSEDRFVKAVVGHQGQLVELEIDRRAYRRPSDDLAATIVATVRAAAGEATSRVWELIDQNVPSARGFLGGVPPEGLDLANLIPIHDPDLRRLLDEGISG